VYQHPNQPQRRSLRQLTDRQRAVLQTMLDEDLMLQQHDDVGSWLVACVGGQSCMSVRADTFLSLQRAGLIKPVGVTLPAVFISRPCNYYRVSPSGRAAIASL
jgi:hypothetical protein